MRSLSLHRCSNMLGTYSATLAGNLGMLSAGMPFGWASPSIPRLLQGDSQMYLTLEQAAWVASLLTLGGTFGSLTCVFIVNAIGRKRTMLLMALPISLSWLMIGFATTPWELYAARFISGIAVGNSYVATTMYIGEISPAPIRGMLGTMLTVAAKAGALAGMTIGPFLSVSNAAFVSLTVPVLFFLIFLRSPESPYHLMRRGRKDEAIQSLVRLRGKRDVLEEAEIIEKSVKADLANSAGLGELLFVPGNRKALLLLIGLIAIQQCSGSLVVLSYAQMIFDAAKIDFEGKYLTIILGAVQVASTVVSTTMVDRVGRRSLLMLSTLGTAVATGMVGCYFYLDHIDNDTTNLGWLPAAGTLLYIIMYCFGLAGIPFTIMGEVFPTNVKAIGVPIVMSACNLFAFTVTRSYQEIINRFGIYTAFWLFSGLSVVGSVLIFFYVPETKGKTLQEIQNELHGKSTQLTQGAPQEVVGVELKPAWEPCGKTSERSPKELGCRRF